MKQYEEYKDTGVKWIPKIPKHWGIEPFGRHFSYGKGLPITKADLLQEGVAVISYGQIHSKLNRGTTISTELVRYVSPSYLGSNLNSLLQSGDFVFADTSEDVEGSGNFAYNDYEAILFAGYHTVIARPKDLGNTKYYAYLFLSKPWKNQVQSLVNGVKVYSIGKRHLKKSILLIPPLAEQEKIVSFLESKTLSIDTYIAEKERELHLLNELKKSEIVNVITRGLNPDVKMKDSGIPWIGMIPEHWGIRRLSQVSYEHFISNKNIHHQNLLSLSYGRIIRKDINTTEGLLPASFDTYQVVDEGNIVLRLTDLQNDQKSLRVGLVKEEGIVTSAYVCIGILNNAIIPSYLYNTLHSFDIKKLFYSMGGGLRQNLNWQGLKKIDIPLPPIEEQKAIVAYIEDKCNKISSLISELEAEIEYLKEYKQKLIADCVTGQIKVTE